MGRRRKKLSDDDRALWSKVADSTVPLSDAQRNRLTAPDAETGAGAAPVPPPIPDPQPKSRPPQISLRPAPISREPRTRVNLAPDPMAAPAPSSIGMDRKRYRQMSQGKLRPEARLDLHGMTLSRAHSALQGFLLRAYAERMRLVLVITGKGNTARPEAHHLGPQRGVLRHNLPHWVDQPPLSQIVLQLAPAHRRHGGGGAYYIYLRRTD
ncbi:Smr/MutS family protein [Oceanomicrobium pacificus]|uniref:DNA mismatch repair protein MutS n=1 Tax=Oceanomicrobium pacificus TaxID=2692916 RepID=A0A6B0TSE3_9RHOB|nr:Smr/MutS family protein [Oceanomicrobium pacificus]MXU64725.1 DNA mismatch repair protein MutS [Oceanomicrobium pacificus]